MSDNVISLQHPLKEYAATQEVATTSAALPSAAAKDVLTQILHKGAQALLVQAIEADVADWIDRQAHPTGENGRRLVVDNGRLPKRRITTRLAVNAGPISKWPSPRPVGAGWGLVEVDLERVGTDVA